MVGWLFLIAITWSTRAASESCIGPEGRIENMTVILDRFAFPPSETPRSVEAIGEDGACYGSTVMEPNENAALAVWGADDFVVGGLNDGDRFNITLEYYPDAVVTITTAQRDTTLSEVIDELTVKIGALQSRADSLQGLVDSFPGQAAEIERLSRALVVSDSIRFGLASEIAVALTRLTALSEVME